MRQITEIEDKDESAIEGRIDGAGRSDASRHKSIRDKLLHDRLRLKKGSNVAPLEEKGYNDVKFTHLLNPKRRLESRVAPGLVANRRINNTKQAELITPDGEMDMAGIKISDVTLTTTSAGAITSYPFKQRMDQEIAESCWVVNGKDLLTYFTYDVNDQHTVARIQQLSLTNHNDYVIAAPFSVLDPDNDGELLLNPLRKLDNVGTYMHPGAHGYCWNGSSEVKTITLHDTTFDNVDEIEAIAPAINNSPTVNSKYCLPYEFAYYCLMASGVIEGGSGGFTTRIRYLVNQILAEINTHIFSTLELRASGQTLSSLTISMEEWYLLLANYFTKGVVSGSGLVVDTNCGGNGAEVDSITKIISDTIKISCKDVSVFIPDYVIGKKFEYRGLVCYPIRFKIRKSASLTVIANHVKYESHGCHYYLSIAAEDSTFYYVDGYIDGILYPESRDGQNLFDIAEIADRSGLTIIISGFIAIASSRLKKNGEESFDAWDFIRYKYVDPDNRSFLYKKEYKPTVVYSVGSSYEGVPNFCFGNSDYLMGNTFSAGVMAAARYRTTSTGISKSDFEDMFTFDHNDFGASRYLTCNKEIYVTPAGDARFVLPLTDPSVRASKLYTSSVWFYTYNYTSVTFSDVVNDPNGPMSLIVLSSANPTNSPAYTIAGSDLVNIMRTVIDNDHPYNGHTRKVIFDFSRLSPSVRATLEGLLSDGDHFLCLQFSRKSSGSLKEWYEISSVGGYFDFYIGQETVEVNPQARTTAFEDVVKNSYNRKETYFDCTQWDDVIGYVISMEIDPDFYASASAETQAYLESIYKNGIKACINSATIRHAFADLNRLTYDQAVELFTIMNDSIDPTITSKLLLSVKETRTNRVVSLVNRMLGALEVDKDEVPENFITGDEPSIEDLSNYIDSIEMEVDQNYALDFPTKQVDYDEDTKTYKCTFGEVFNGVTLSSLNITMEDLNIQGSDEEALFTEYYNKYERYSLSSLIAALQDDSISEDERKFLYGVVSLEFRNLGDEYSTLLGDILGDRLEDTVDDILDDETIYDSDNEQGIVSQIDNLITSINDNFNIESNKDNAQALVNGAIAQSSEFFNNISGQVRERFSKLAANTKNSAIEYYRTVRTKVAEEAEQLNNVLSFKVTNLINMVKSYGNDLQNYLTSVTASKAMNKSDYGWQDTSLFTPASNISLATGLVGNGLLGALSVGLSLLKRVANGLATTIRGAITTAVQDGVSFKKRLTGFETLGIQCASKIFSPTYLNETYTWLAEKLLSNLTGFNDVYIMCQVGNLYLFFQDAPNGQIMITANPKLKLRDDTDISNDWSTAVAMAESIRECLTKQNLILSKCLQFGIINQFSEYDVPSRDKLLEDILNRAQGKSAEGVILAKSIIWGVGIVLGAILCCTGYGSVAGIALIAGACAVGSAMCGEPETQSKIERLENDSIYANGLITSSDLVDIWCDAIPASMIDLELAMLDFLSNCSIQKGQDVVYMDLVSDGSGGSIDFVDSNYPEFDGIGFVPMVIMAGAPRFKYRLVTDAERTAKSVVILSALVAAAAVAVAKATSATMKKVKQRRMDKIAAQQWSLHQPSKDDDKYAGMSDSEMKAALKADQDAYLKTQFKYARKSTRISNSLARAEGTSSDFTPVSVFKSVMTNAGSVVAGLEVNNEGVNVNWENMFKTKEVSDDVVEVQGAVSGIDGKVDTVTTNVSNVQTAVETVDTKVTDGNQVVGSMSDLVTAMSTQLGTDEKTIVQMLNEVISGTGGTATWAAVLAGLALILGVGSASAAGVALAKAIKNSSKGSDNNM